MIPLSTIGIIFAVAFVCYLAYIGYSPLVSGPIAAVIICLTSQLSLEDGILSSYVGSFASMVRSVVLIFLSCMIFARILVENKMAFSIAEFLARVIGPKYAPLTIMILCAILRLGGMNQGAYVIAYTIGLVLCHKANYSEDIIMGSIMGGCWTFANCAPFYPSIVNTITMRQLGTSTSAGLVPGLVSCVIMFAAIVGYLMWQANSRKKKGRVFTAQDMLPKEEEHTDYPPVWISLIPLTAVMILFNVFSWDISFSVIVGCVLATALTFKKHTFKEWTKIWERGALECTGPVFALAAMSGIGGVVATTPFYTWIFEWMQSTTIHPYLLTFAASNIMAFALGSGSSGVATCLPVLQPMFENWVAARGLDMGNFHRLLVSGSVCLDSLPHNGTISAMCEMFHTTQKKSYYPAMWTTVIIPFAVGLLITVPLAMMGFH